MKDKLNSSSPNVHIQILHADLVHFLDEYVDRIW